MVVDFFSKKKRLFVCQWGLVFLFVFLVGLPLSAYSQSALRDVPYPQEFRAFVRIPGGKAANDVRALAFDRDSTLWAATGAGLFALRSGHWQADSFFKQKPLNAVYCDARGDLWVLENQTVFKKTGRSWKKQAVPKNTRIHDVRASFFLPDSTLWVGLKDGLAQATVKDLLRDVGPFSLFRPVQALYTDPDGTLWLGIHREGLVRLSPDGIRTLYIGLDGLPYDDILGIAGNAHALWVATSWGVFRFDRKNRWDYYASKRWLAGDRVRGIALNAQGDVFTASPNGISKIFTRRMTLEEKTAIYEEKVRKRHDRFGLVAESDLTVPGDLSSNKMRDDDNDGLWTSIYVGAECFRYAVTHDEDARKRAIHSFSAMERLVKITGIPGFPARSFIPAKDYFPGKGGEWHLTPDGKWYWKGDTSSDEIVGHYFAYALVYELIDDPAVKKRAKNLIVAITDHILSHHFNLCDVDGKPTRWGVWNPDSLNGPRILENGLNSLEILAFLRTAYGVTGHQKYLKAYRMLIEKYGYARNTINQKITFPEEINYSDDELAYLPYYLLFRYEDDPELLKIYRKSIERTYRYVKSQENPLWNAITSVALKKPLGLAAGLKTLRDYPVDLIEWTVRNSQRRDLIVNPYSVGRNSERQSLRVIPADERRVMKWNTSPFTMDGGSGGRAEQSGMEFLLPYWMMRYHKLIQK